MATTASSKSHYFAGLEMFEKSFCCHLTLRCMVLYLDLPEMAMRVGGLLCSESTPVRCSMHHEYEYLHLILPSAGVAGLPREFKKFVQKGGTKLYPSLCNHPRFKWDKLDYLGTHKLTSTISFDLLILLPQIKEDMSLAHISTFAQKAC